MTDPYMPDIKPNQTGVGNPEAKILILIDHPDEPGRKEGGILKGPALSAFQQCLHMADLITADIYMMSVVPDDSRPKKWWVGGNSKRPTRDISLQRERVADILEHSSANITLAMGDLSHYICTGRNKLSSDRGYIFPCVLEGLEETKIMPVQDIKGMIWSNYIWRYYLASDLKKAAEQSNSPKLTYDERYPISIRDFEQARTTLEKYENQCAGEGIPLGVDIEVSNYEVSHIGLSLIGEIGISIPFDNHTWTLEQEVELWKLMAHLLSNEYIPKVGQNFIFDIHFLLMRNNIYVKGQILDTMMAQSIIFPDFLKGLNFLGSVYLNVPEWKSDVKFKNIKKES